MWVQNFVESPLRAPEEVVIFVAPAHMGRRGAIAIVLAAIFVVFIFAKGDLLVEILHHAKISRYTVCILVENICTIASDSCIIRVITERGSKGCVHRTVQQ